MRASGPPPCDEMQQMGLMGESLIMGLRHVTCGAAVSDTSAGPLEVNDTYAEVGQRGQIKAKGKGEQLDTAHNVKSALAASHPQPHSTGTFSTHPHSRGSPADAATVPQ